ncbi:unnamed protein product [Bursaphelenchus okinawaensis]|uniref:RING-type E3 ubiquitin transferase n=1 Tax=Bursaphelenchus okinawaensis TaxID=465554 RepID=A0A811KM86_9BILA|nr:unnamed protein product [Bursaphelenchus okinawaensis]CAG9105893.1 unnamed protein product [Bursaphelenchus okinawaensis]
MNHRNGADFLHCHNCHRVFSSEREPINLPNSVCCKPCVRQLIKNPDLKIKCHRDAEKFPVNSSFLRILGISTQSGSLSNYGREGIEKDILRKIDNIFKRFCDYFQVCDEDGTFEIQNDSLSKFVQKRLVCVLSAPVLLPEGRYYIVKCSKSIVERVVTELVLSRQTSAHISSALWSAVRTRGCQFLGPPMQAEVLRLVIQALSDGELIARKALVLYIVESMAETFPQVSKTCVGHVVQLLYRASCFNVIKRDGESSLMQLKDEFRVYPSLRREHDSQIVQIALEAGLRIAPEQWSQLLYGDSVHKQQMDSIIEQLAEPHTLTQNEEQALRGILQEGEDGHRTEQVIRAIQDVMKVEMHDKMSYSDVGQILSNLETIVQKYAMIAKGKNQDLKNLRRPEKVDGVVTGQRMYKTRICRDILNGRPCPRGDRCNYAHNPNEVRHNGGQAMPLEPSGQMLIQPPFAPAPIDPLACQFNDMVQIDNQQPQQLVPHEMVEQSVILDSGLAQAAAAAAANGSAPPVVVPVVMHHQDIQSGLVQPSFTHGLMFPNDDPNSGGTLILPTDTTNPSVAPAPMQPVQMAPVMPSDPGMVPVLSNTMLVQPSIPPTVQTTINGAPLQQMPAQISPMNAGLPLNPIQPLQPGAPRVQPGLQHVQQNIQHVQPNMQQMPQNIQPMAPNLQPVQPPMQPVPTAPIGPLQMGPIAPPSMMFNQNSFWYSEHQLPKLDYNDNRPSYGQQFGQGHQRHLETPMRFPDSIWEITDDQVLLARRHEIVSCLNQMRDDIKTVEEDDDIRSHVSYTVANFVLFDDVDVPNTKLELPPLPSLNTLPISFADSVVVPPPVFSGTRDLCAPRTETNSRLDSMSSDSHSLSTPGQESPTKKLSQSSQPLLFGSSPRPLSTVRTMCPNAMFNQKTTAPATVQADCSVMNVKDMFEKPLVISTIQQSNLCPQASYEMVDPINMVDHVPQVIRPLSLKSDPQHIVSATLDRILNVKERIYDVDKIGGSGSAVEKAQLKLELNIVNRQISSLDTPTKQSCLLKELEAVDKQIEDMSFVA